VNSQTASSATGDVNAYGRYGFRGSRIGIALSADARPLVHTGDVVACIPHSDGRRHFEAPASTSPPTQQRPAPHGDSVAWSLVAAAHSRLRRPAAHHIYIAIGVGDTFDAIEALLAFIVEHHLRLDADLRAAVAAWLDRYRGQDAERRLRELLRREQPAES
jgi:hypothetical protein